MIPLMILAFIGTVVFLERSFFLHKYQIRVVEFVEGIKAALKKRRFLEAITLCEETPGAIPRIIKAALINSEASFDVMRQAVLTQVNIEVPYFERRISTVALIARIAPYMGFLGTLISILEMLYTMSQSGSYADASMFSSEIYNALISTIVGVCIFIVAAVCTQFLYSRLKAVTADMQWSANVIMKFIADGMPENENLILGSQEAEEK